MKGQKGFMKGLELCQSFYNEYGAPMLEKEFPDLVGIVAVGLCGSGSECFGYDDEYSRDHDFEPGFCIFIPDESIIDNKLMFELEKAYSKLPKEYMGFSRATTTPVGGKRHGVIRADDFFREKCGRAEGDLSLQEWFFIPEQGLLEATNGKIFRDDFGALSEIRERLSFMPEVVRLKKLAGHLLLMGQAGQYNYKRCVGRGETAAAQLAVGEFVKNTLHAIFLLNKKYMPYYKWCFRALRDLPLLCELHSDLEYLISSGNSAEDVVKKSEIIENICTRVGELLLSAGLSDFKGDQCEGHAYSVNNKIQDNEIRNLHILYGV